jgi:protein ImuA
MVRQLQREVLSLQGGRRAADSQRLQTGLGPIEMAFPGRVFPMGAVHEFVSRSAADAAATSGFIAGLLGRLMQQQGACLWIGTKRTVFPPALKVFGIDPARIIFVDLYRQKDVLWAIEEALKCDALAAVVGEPGALSFTESRRLQLAVEQSRVTGFIHRVNARTDNTVACVTRWKITSIASITEDGMPGVGYPRWHVQLVKVRNGKPGTWQVEWSEEGFRNIPKKVFSIPEMQQLKAG